MVLRGSKLHPDSMQDALSHRQDATQPKQIDRVLKQLAAGGAAGAIARTIVAPLDRVKILMQTQRLLFPQPNSAAAATTVPASTSTPVAASSSLLRPVPAAPAATVTPDKYRAMFQTMSLIAREEGGFRNLWRGNLTNIMRVMPYSAAQFACYDYMKSKVVQSRKDASNGNLTTVGRLGCGAAAGIVATSITYPLDLIRLRQTVDPSLRGPLAATRSILAEQGAIGVWKGLGATLWSLTPFIAINFAAFDGFKSYLYPRLDDQGRKIIGRSEPSPYVILTLGAASGLCAQTLCYPLDTVRRRMQLPGTYYANMLQGLRSILVHEGMSGLYRGMGANAAKVVPLAAIRFWAYEVIKGWLDIKGGGGGD